MIWAQVFIVAWLWSLFGLRLRFLYVKFVLLGLLLLLPLHDGVSVAMAMRGLWGDPSITSLQLMLLTLFGRTPLVLHHGWRVPASITLAAFALYANALGPWDIDQYRLGYQPAALVAVLGAIALIAWWRGYALFLWLLAIDLLAWRAGWLESTNLWDYLLDPLLMLVMAALALRNSAWKKEVKC